MTIHFTPPVNAIACSGPGRRARKGIGLVEAVQYFGNPQKAKAWMENARWKDEITCPHCQSNRCTRTKNHLPYRCKDCRKRFSLKTKTPMADSNLPIEQWLLAIYLDLTNLKGISSLKLSRDLQIGQPNAWYMLHRIREAFMSDVVPASFAKAKVFQIDEVHIGGKEPNKHAIDKIPGGQGGANKMIVIGITEVQSGDLWVDVIENKHKSTIKEIVERVTPKNCTIYTDDASYYDDIEDRTRKAVNHSQGEYVRTEDAAKGMADRITTNYQESAWSMLRRGIIGIYHKIPPKHLRRYVRAFAWQWNIRNLGTESQMRAVVRAMMDRSLTYTSLTADNGLASGSGDDGAIMPEKRRRYQERSPGYREILKRAMA